MRVSDVVRTSEFHIEVRVSGPEGALERPIDWTVPTEAMDPSGFLTSGALVLTSGVALNVTDPRIWDAYVERLVKVPVAALVFGVGPAHKQVPQGLEAACAHYGLPLLVVPSDVPFPLVHREVQDTVSAERYEMIRDGSALAQRCTELVARGGTLQDLLEQIAAAAGERVSVEDRTGAELLRAGGPGPLLQRTEFTLPTEDADSFRLVVEVSTPSQMMSPLIQPVTAVLAMHLAAALGSTAVVHSRGAGRLVGAIFARSSIATEELVSLAQEAELDPYRPIGAVVLQAEPGRSITYLRTLSWRIRTRLAAEYPTMRFVEDADMSTMLVQGRGLEAARLQDSVRTAMGRSPAARGMVDAVVNAAELGLVLRHMRRCVDAGTDAAGVRRAPPMSFDALVDALRHPGTESMARRLVAPLAAAEHAPLRETLEVFLRSSGTTAAVCDELFIHRNTLAHRIRKIEELLGIGLQDGQSRALLMLSLRLA